MFLSTACNFKEANSLLIKGVAINECCRMNSEINAVSTNSDQEHLNHVLSKIEEILAEME